MAIWNSRFTLDVKRKQIQNECLRGNKGVLRGWLFLFILIFLQGLLRPEYELFMFWYSPVTCLIKLHSKAKLCDMHRGWILIYFKMLSTNVNGFASSPIIMTRQKDLVILVDAICEKNLLPSVGGIKFWGNLKYVPMPQQTQTNNKLPMENLSNPFDINLETV